MVGFIPILALCAAVNGEPDMSRCTYVDDVSFAYSTITACEMRALSILRSDEVKMNVSFQLYQQYGYMSHKLAYKMWCIEDDNVDDFYQRIGISTEGLPHGA